MLALPDTPREVDQVQQYSTQWQLRQIQGLGSHDLDFNA